MKNTLIQKDETQRNSELNQPKIGGGNELEGGGTQQNGKTPENQERECCFSSTCTDKNQGERTLFFI
ncbi:MAG: hypothetical protein ACRC8Y_12770 [Chroococcales cyanobacterium]